MTSYDHALAEYRARMDAQDEALRREAWHANAPVREAGRMLLEHMGPRERHGDGL